MVKAQSPPWRHRRPAEAAAMELEMPACHDKMVVSVHAGTLAWGTIQGLGFRVQGQWRIMWNMKRRMMHVDIYIYRNT